MGVLQVAGLGMRFNRGDAPIDVLHDVTLEIGAGESVAIVGPSGAGKSTLLHLLGAMERPTEGKVVVNGQDVAALSDDEMAVLRRRRLGFVFQFFQLLPALSALDNVAVPAILDGASVRVARDRARATLAAVHLAGRAEHRPRELSGGEQQRVAIARALVNDPSVVLADEPTGSLDSATGDAVFEVLHASTAATGRTLVIVTHDPSIAERLERIVELRDGRIVGDTDRRGRPLRARRAKAR